MRWSNSKQNPFKQRSKPPAESMSGMHFAKSSLQIGRQRFLHDSVSIKGNMPL